MEAISLDSKTIIIKSDNEGDISDILSYVSKKSKSENMQALFNFASQHRVLDKDFVFSRDECYAE